MFSSKNKKKQLSELEMLKKDWRKFKSNFEKIIMDPVKLETSSRKCLEEELKPKLQSMLDIILTEDTLNRDDKTIGDCLEFTLKEGIL